MDHFKQTLVEKGLQTILGYRQSDYVSELRATELMKEPGILSDANTVCLNFHWASVSFKTKHIVFFLSLGAIVRFWFGFECKCVANVQYIEKICYSDM